MLMAVSEDTSNLEVLMIFILRIIIYNLLSGLCSHFRGVVDCIILGIYDVRAFAVLAELKKDSRTMDRKLDNFFQRIPVSSSIINERAGQKKIKKLKFDFRRTYSKLYQRKDSNKLRLPYKIRY